MSYPPLFVVTAPAAPDVVATTEFRASVTTAAGKSFNHVSGEVKGRALRYADLNACAWFLPGGGWELRNHRKLRRRGLSGAGDTDGSARR